MSTAAARSPATLTPRRRVHPIALPEGLTYVPGVLIEAEERDVLAVLATFELYPSLAGHQGAVVDDLPDPAARCSRHTVSGRTRLTVRSTRGRSGISLVQCPMRVAEGCAVRRLRPGSQG
jgi:hypothetical protein